jgi:hypothetical protein
MLSLFDELGAMTDCRFCDCDEEIVGRATAFKMDVAASRSFCWERRRDCSGMSVVFDSALPLLPLAIPLPPLPLSPALTAPPTPPSKVEVELEITAAAAAPRRPRLTLPSPKTTLHSGILACGPMVTPAQTLVCAPITL